ncbi:MAG: hypothetical protein ACTSO9_00170 [Candidatus Helarchaeota archaeon]
MKRKLKIFYISFFITAVLFLSFPVYKIRAIGPAFEEVTNGFAVKKGDTWDLKVLISINPPVWMPNFSAGDLLRYTVIETNNSQFSEEYDYWIADCVWTKKEYFNNTAKNWSVVEGLIGAYNSTHTCNNPYPPGQYNYIGYKVIPLNFTAVNHTIVNTSYTYMNCPTNFNFSTPTPPNVAGTWIMWSGNSTTPGSEKHEITYNDLGIVIRICVYKNGTSDWKKIFDAKSVNECSYDLLLVLLIQNIKTIDINLIIGIVITISSIGLCITLMIYKKAAQKYK